MDQDHYMRYHSVDAIHSWARADYNELECSSNPEIEAYWASLSTADKIRGALISILAGGGIGGLLGYLIMY
mgnify:CR=1 FL=1